MVGFKEMTTSKNSVKTVSKSQTRGLKPFKPGESGNPFGRPKKLVGQILDDLRASGYQPVTKSQISDVYQTLIILPEEDLKLIANDKDQPMLNRIIVKAILGGKGFENIEKILDRAQGKAMQSNDITSGGEALKGWIIEKYKGE